jgi:ADP-ribose pyrophosphatase YjhB (NUDIX family)
MNFENPVPVAVVLVPVYSDGLTGLLLVKRKDGGLALPGGFMEVKHGSWQGTAVTEMEEETGIVITNDLSIEAVHSTPDNRRLLVFCLWNDMLSLEKVPTDFKPNDEVEGLEVWWQTLEKELKFPLHQRVAEDYFASI